MKTEQEFNDWLKKCLRRARKGLWVVPIAKKMDMKVCVYKAYERGDLTLSVYQLYQFMHTTGKDVDFIKQIFDDDWRKPSTHMPRTPDNR